MQFQSSEIRIRIQNMFITKHVLHIQIIFFVVKVLLCNIKYEILTHESKQNREDTKMIFIHTHTTVQSSGGGWKAEFFGVFMIQIRIRIRILYLSLWES